MHRRPLLVTLTAQALRLEQAFGEDVVDILAIPSRHAHAARHPLRRNTPVLASAPRELLV
jgi:hypothetical protein